MKLDRKQVWPEMLSAIPNADRQGQAAGVCSEETAERADGDFCSRLP